MQSRCGHRLGVGRWWLSDFVIRLETFAAFKEEKHDVVMLLHSSLQAVQEAVLRRISATAYAVTAYDHCSNVAQRNQFDFGKKLRTPTRCRTASVVFRYFL